MNTSFWTRADLKQKAKQVLKVNYWPALLVSILLGIASGGGGGGGGGGSARSSSGMTDSSAFESGSIGDWSFAEAIPQNINIMAIIIGSTVALVIIAFMIALSVFVFSSLEVSCQRFFATSAAVPHSRLEELGYGFKRENYMPIVKTMFFKKLYIFLWSLLLVIPGIIKSYSYRMVPYIMTESPDMAHDAAITMSREMMNGQKWKTFVLDLSFIGWYLLGMLACCIGVIFVAPYQYSTNAQLYLALNNTDEPDAQVYSE